MSAQLQRPPRASRILPERRPALLLISLLLVALNLRLGITSMGALLDRLESQGLSAGVTALLTSLPVICFAAVSSTGMRLARRIGAHRGLAVALGMLASGLVVRVLQGPVVLVAGTVVACSGIAVANVLLPALAKEHFPHRIGGVTGAYSGALAIGAALGAAVTVPVTDLGGGWRVGLGMWAAIAVAALVAWAPWCRTRDTVRGRVANARLWRSPVAWAITVLFATQSVFAYVSMSWLPTIYADAGFSDATAGALLAFSILVGVPVNLVMPSVAIRLPAQGHLIAVLSTLVAVSFLGLWLAPAGGAWLWAGLLGAGGGVFPTTLTLFALRTETPADTAAMSAMAQSAGYSLAAAGPLVFGILADLSESWAVPCALLSALATIQIFAGYVAGRPLVIGGAGAPRESPCEQ